MPSYKVIDTDNSGRVRCGTCQGNVFNTPEPVSDPFWTGRFWCSSCGYPYDASNIAQDITFADIDAGDVLEHAAQLARMSRARLGVSA